MAHSLILILAVSCCLLFTTKAFTVSNVDVLRLFSPANSGREGEVQVLSQVGNEYLPECAGIEAAEDRTYCYFLRFVLSQVAKDWLPVCGDNFGLADARAVCHLLGFQNEDNSPIMHPYFYVMNRYPDGEHVDVTSDCSGDEDRINSCQMTAYAKPYCANDHVAVVVCGPDIRLVNGELPTEGRLEIHRSNEWGTICDYDHDNAVAEVVCRILGFSPREDDSCKLIIGMTGSITETVIPVVNFQKYACHGVVEGAVVLPYAHFGEGPGPVHLGSVKCNGKESSLDDCQAEEVFLCGGTYEIGIRCGPGIRLVDGRLENEGRLEIYRSNEWSTVCDNNFNDAAAQVVCRILKYPVEGAKVIRGAYFGEGTESMQLNGVMCTGEELSLDDCQANVNPTCDHDRDVSIRCAPAVRLVNGESPTVGRLEIYRSNEWGTVCERETNFDVAVVVCRILGFSIDGVEILRGVPFGKGNGPIALTAVRCKGDESRLEDCQFNNVNSNMCNHYSDVSIRCGQGIRLVNGTSLAEGRLEMYRFNEWATVCNRNFNHAAAKQVCRLLQFPFLDAKILSAAYFGEGAGSIILDEVFCTAEEANLGNCEANVNPTCGHDRDVSMRCGPLIRLINGVLPTHGRLEVYRSDEWGVVCSDSFGDNDAKVVCRTMGFLASYARATQMSRLGEGTGPIYLDDLACTGDETSFFDCPANTVHNCLHSEIAYVICGPSIRLVNGANQAEGRLEIYRSNEWGTVCGISFNEAAARVACRALRLQNDGAEVLPQIYYGKGTGSIHLDGVICTGEEASLDECQANVNPICDHDSDVSIRCGHTIRLVSSLTAGEGRVEVLRSGVWGTVCNRDFDDNGAKVVCRALGFLTEGAEALKGAFFGSGTGPIHMTSVKCNGDEASLDECQANGDIKYCDHSYDASVRCGPVVRLAYGGLQNEGRLEIYRSSEWSTVCDNNFNDAAARVVCRILEFPDYGAEILPGAYFGKGTGPILLDGVICTGVESSLDDCQIKANSTCNHDKDVSIRCDPGIRLVDGENPTEGRLEIFYKFGAWGTVKDESGYFDKAEAAVACRQLGFSTYYATKLAGTHFGEGTGLVNIAFINCAGDESSLDECRHYNSNFFTHTYDVGLRCGPNIRLMGGANIYEGRLDLYRYETWGSLCANSFNEAAARVVCRTLGFQVDGAEVLPSVDLEHSSGPIQLAGVICTGDESRLEDCQEDINFDCDHVGIRCGPDIRLMNGLNAAEGRLEVLRSGEWGTVCDTGFSNKDAVVVCRALGFPTVSAEALGNAHFGQGTVPVLLNAVVCSGFELRLDDCQAYGNPRCGHANDVSVRCGPSVRLVDGANIYEGRLEIHRSNAWGTVCDSSFHEAAAQVVCRALGFQIGEAEVLPAAHFGEGIGPVLWDAVTCTGQESSLDECQAKTTPTCDHDKDVSIRCGPDIRLVGGSNKAEGRLEIMSQLGVWYTVCDDGAGNAEAKVACRSLGFPTDYAFIKFYSYFGEGTGPQRVGYMKCTGDELHLDDCPVNTESTPTCGHDEDISVICGPSIRLMEGANAFEGRLEIYRSKEWGTICDTSFNEAAARVVCRTLGYQIDGTVLLAGAYFGEGKGSIQLDSVICTGEEPGFDDCQANVNPTCGHDRDISVRCGPTIRLVNGSTAAEGRLEVLISGEWGTVCAVGISITTPEAVCRILGFSIEGAEAVPGAYFGEGTGPVHFSYLTCKGFEMRLDDCITDTKYACQHADDVGIRCGTGTGTGTD